jgi:hypothetical protein
VVEHLLTSTPAHPDSPWVVTAGEWVEVRLPQPLPAVDLTWKVLPEATNTKAGGDFEQSLGALRVPMRNRADGRCLFKAPSEEGAYRMYALAVNRDGQIAYANRPFYVLPPRPSRHWAWRWNFIARP